MIPTVAEAKDRREATPTPGIVCECTRCGYMERLPHGADGWEHRCSRKTRWRHSLAKRLIPEYDYPRYCGTCSHLIMPREQWGASCVHCSSRARAAKSKQ